MQAASGAAFLVFFAALAARGAGDAPLAAALSLALCLLLAAQLALWPAARLAEAARRNVIPLAAALVFIAWSLAGAWIGGPETPAFWRALWHPLWAEFGQSHGALSISPYRTVEGVAAFLAPCAAFALGALNVQSRQERDMTGRLLAALAIGFAVYSLALLIQGAGLRGGRLMATLGSPNAAATTLGVLAMFMAALVVRGARGRLGNPPPRASHPLAAWLAIVQGAPITFAALILVVACALLTGSRAGLLVFAGAFFILVALVRAPAGGQDDESRSISAFVILGGLALLLFVLGGGFVLSRFSDIDIDSETRRVMIETHWRAFLERPILGHGLNTFHELNAHYADPANWDTLRPIGSAHNIVVQLLEEVGLIGALVFSVMVAPPLWRALMIAWRDRPGAEWAAATVAAAALVLGHGMVDFGLQVPALAALFAYALGAYSNGDAKAPARAPAVIEDGETQSGFRFRTLEER